MESKFVAEQKFKKKIKHTELCEKEKNSRKKEKSKSLNQYFFVQKYYERRKWKKEIGVKIRKQNFQKHILHKKLESRFVGEKNTKIPGQKLLETSIGVKNLKQKKSGKNI